jgi:uroporphyrinogen-III synthase
MRKVSFHGAKVLAFESRRAQEIAELIRLNGGEPFVAPALTEVPIEHNTEAFTFADWLYTDQFDMVIFLTGVGARYLQRVIATRDGEERLPEALRKVKVVVRGPKPSAVMREWRVPVTVQVPEPNTYRELLEAVKNRPEKSVAIQEYGRTNQELLAGLEAQGRRVTTVPVYQWSLPENTEPLRQALDGLLRNKFDVTLFTTGVQIEHLLQFAEEQGRKDEVIAGLHKTFITSIGPTCSEALRESGLHPALEPSHPKMGLLVRETALRYAEEKS